MKSNFVANSQLVETSLFLNSFGFKDIKVYSGTLIRIVKETEKQIKGAGMISFPVGDFLNLGLGNIFTRTLKHTEVFLNRDDTGFDVYYELPNCDFIGIEGQKIVVIESDSYPILLINLSMNQKTICPHPQLAELTKRVSQNPDEKQALSYLIDSFNYLPTIANLSVKDIDEAGKPFMQKLEAEAEAKQKKLEMKISENKKGIGYLATIFCWCICIFFFLALFANITNTSYGIIGNLICVITSCPLIHKNLNIRRWLYIVLFFIGFFTMIGSTNSSNIKDNTKTEEVTNTEKYTPVVEETQYLNQSTAGEWQNASKEKRMETARLFVLINKNMRSKNEWEIEKVATELEKCITTATDDVRLSSQKVSEIGALCSIMLGIPKL